MKFHRNEYSLLTDRKLDGFKISMARFCMLFCGKKFLTNLEMDLFRTIMHTL